MMIYVIIILLSTYYLCLFSLHPQTLDSILRGLLVKEKLNYRLFYTNNMFAQQQERILFLKYKLTHSKQFLHCVAPLFSFLLVKSGLSENFPTLV